MPALAGRGELSTFPVTLGSTWSIWASAGGGTGTRSQLCMPQHGLQPGPASPNSRSSHISASAAILGLKPPWVGNLPLQERKKKSTTNGCSLKTLYFPLSPSWFKRPLIIIAAKAGSLLRQWEAQNNSFKALEEGVSGIKIVESQEIMRKKKAMIIRVWSARATRPHQAWAVSSAQLSCSIPRKGILVGTWEKAAPGAGQSRWKFGRGSWGGWGWG